jgi:hypothetical protein
VSLFPALERALDLNRKGPLTLLTRYQTPARLRRTGHKRMAAYLRNRGVKGSYSVAQKALAAAKSQSVALPAEETSLPAYHCRARRRAERCSSSRITSRASTRSLNGVFSPARRQRSSLAIPGMGPILGAEFLVASGDLRSFGSADRLAAYAGLVPAANDSGKRVGNHKRMRGGNKALKKRVFYQSAFSSLPSAPESRAFYDRKRREGKRHTQALIALARRRVDVLWAMLRDGTMFETRSAA